MQFNITPRLGGKNPTWTCRPFTIVQTQTARYELVDERVNRVTHIAVDFAGCVSAAEKSEPGRAHA
jgi:hypothetical protein